MSSGFEREKGASKWWEAKLRELLALGFPDPASCESASASCRRLGAYMAQADSRN